MTESERIAAEHIAHRRRCGWTWTAIRREARACLRAVGRAMASDLHQLWALERAFAIAWEETRMRRLRGAA